MSTAIITSIDSNCRIGTIQSGLLVACLFLNGCRSKLARLNDNSPAFMMRTFPLKRVKDASLSRNFHFSALSSVFSTSPQSLRSYAVHFTRAQPVSSSEIEVINRKTVEVGMSSFFFFRFPQPLSLSVVSLSLAVSHCTGTDSIKTWTAVFGLTDAPVSAAA